MNGEKLKQNLETFLRHIDSIRDTLPMTMLLLEPYNAKANDAFVQFLKNNVKEIEDDKGKKKILIKSDEAKLFETLERNASISALASKIIPQSLFVSLISQYDAFLNRLLRAVFEIKPEILNTSDRNLTFSQLVDMDSIKVAREYIIEKEVETILRKSHSEHFDYLESKLSLSLRKGLPIWQTFIEITERRNLLVHCDGMISSQYVKNCKENNCNISNTKIGVRLDVSHEYFIAAYNCLYEIAVKLTHTLWRKLAINDLKNADRELNEVCFHLINNKAFTLADKLLVFGHEQNKHYDDAFKSVFVINAALSKYLQGKKNDAKSILNSKDWSATSDDFKLAYDVLTDNFEGAYKIMLKIGKNGDVDSSDYKEWPLFTEIRKEDKFKATYKKVFREDYKVLETPMRPVQEIINTEIRSSKELKKITIKKVNSTKEIKEESAKIIPLKKSMRGIKKTDPEP